jgi:RNase P protein component
LRLRRRADFASVYDRGRILNDPLLVLRVSPNGLSHNRYGFVVSKRVGGAVVRNRVRRRLQEVVRLAPGSKEQGAGSKAPMAGGKEQAAGSKEQGVSSTEQGASLGYDVMLSCKAAAATARYSELEAAVRRLFVKAGLLEAGS